MGMATLITELFLMPLVAFVIGLFMVLMMRKIGARLQRRIGPPFFQPLIDIKRYLSPEQVKEHLRKGATPDRIMGMTTWDKLNATIHLALNHQNLADLEKTTYQATTVVFYLLINYVKLLPYTWLGQFTAGNLTTSAVMLPVAFAGMLSGVWVHDRVPQALFYRICYCLLFLTGLKLLYDGLSGL